MHTLPSRSYSRPLAGGGHVRFGGIGKHHGEGRLHRSIHPLIPQRACIFGRSPQPGLLRLLQLPPSHPNALLYMGTGDGDLGLPRLSDQVNLRKWFMLYRIQQRGGLPAHAVTGLLTRASEVSGGQLLLPGQGHFIGPFSPTPVWGGSLGALGLDTALRLARTLGPTQATTLKTHPYTPPP